MKPDSSAASSCLTFFVMSFAIILLTSVAALLLTFSCVDGRVTCFSLCRLFTHDNRKHVGWKRPSANRRVAVLNRTLHNSNVVQKTGTCSNAPSLKVLFGRSFPDAL